MFALKVVAIIVAAAVFVVAGIWVGLWALLDSLGYIGAKVAGKGKKS